MKIEVQRKPKTRELIKNYAHLKDAPVDGEGRVIVAARIVLTQTEVRACAKERNTPLAQSTVKSTPTADAGVWETL